MSLFENVQTILRLDPAARSPIEVILCYPSIHVQAFHRVAHWLYERKVTFLPRALMQLARALTGIEIHPGATIGRRLFIDHGMGVVVGETAVIGDDCVLYHHVTLGGTGKERGKRHPTLGCGVIVGAGAAVLGNIVVGEGARIGANSVVLRDVPPAATVVGIPGRVVLIKGQTVEDVAARRESLPDPDAEAIKALADRLYELERQIQSLASLPAPAASEPPSIDQVDSLIHGAGI